MSGICGIIYFDGRRVSAELSLMVEQLAHRGPDGIKLYQEESVGLAHLMLHVTHESLYEQQPLISPSGSILVADARIDNRRELYDILNLYHTKSPLRQANGTIVAEQPLSHSIVKSSSDEPTDAELLLAAYEKWGDEMVYHMVGDFAFALWDKNRQALICGRDHSGVRPFYYYHKPGVLFAFASELKALLALPDVPKRINEAKAAVYLSALTGYRFYQTDTMFQEINSLHFSQIGIFNASSSELKLCIDLQPERFNHLTTREEFAECFKAYFEEAVACRLRTPFGIGSHLSGGLDSSSVSCVAQQHLERQSRSVNTFHFRTNRPETDEMAYAEAVLRRYPSLNHEYMEPHPDFYGSMSLYHQRVGYPETLPLDFHKFRPMYEKLQANSNRVLLTGHDGDTVVGHGRAYLRVLLKEKNWEAFYRRVTEMAKKNGETDQQRDGVLLRYCYEELMTQPGFAKLFYLKKIISGFTQRPLLIVKALAHWRKGSTLITDFPNNSALILERYIPTQKVKTALQRVREPAYSDKNLLILKENSQNSGSLVNTNELMATIGSYYSYDTTHPFLDKRLRELCMAIPLEYKFDDGWRRGPLRRAMSGVLPEEVRTRTSKVEFTPYLYGFWKNLSPSWAAHLEAEKQLYEKKIDTEMLKNNERMLSEGNLSVIEKVILYRSLMYPYFFVNWLENYVRQK